MTDLKTWCMKENKSILDTSADAAKDGRPIEIIQIDLKKKKRLQILTEL